MYFVMFVLGTFVTVVVQYGLFHWLGPIAVRILWTVWFGLIVPFGMLWLFWHNVWSLFLTNFKKRRQNR